MPVATASCPSYKWQNPRMARDLYSLSHVISIRRMVYMSSKWERSSSFDMSMVSFGLVSRL